MDPQLGLRPPPSLLLAAQPLNLMSNCSTPPPETTGHLFWLDWLRFLAAFMVVAIHARGGNWVEWGRLAEASQTKVVAVFFALTRAGTECVLVFFVLSGFLVGGKLIERVTDGSFRMRDYAIDRISRLWVPLVPALVWSAIVAYWVGKPVSWVGFGGNLLGLQVVWFRSFAENIPLWSLAYEIWFYILGGAAALWALSGTRGRIASGFAIAVAFAVFTRLGAEFLFAWLLGALTYWLCSQPRQWSLALMGCVLIGLGYLNSQLRTATVSVDTSSWLRYMPPGEVATVVLSLGMALVLPYVVQLQPRTQLGMRINEMGTKLAAFSYTLYLTHYPLLYVWEHYMPERHGAIDFSSCCLYLLRIASCLLLAWLLYLPFERNTSWVRRQMKRAWSAEIVN
jgi:peptidoglycan/LPS O-acetylase OafA/YrhL